MRQNYIRELTKAIHMKEKGLVASSQRFYHLTKLMDAMHEVGSLTNPQKKPQKNNQCPNPTKRNSHFFSFSWQIVKKVNLFCLSTFIQANTMKVEFPEMMSEVIASQLPKVLAGMVRPLLFHGK